MRTRAETESWLGASFACGLCVRDSQVGGRLFSSPDNVSSRCPLPCSVQAAGVSARLLSAAMASYHNLLRRHPHHPIAGSSITQAPMPSSSRASRSLRISSCRVLPPVPHEVCLPNHSCTCWKHILPVPPPTATRPVVILPGLGNNSKDYVELIFSLKERGLAATVAQVSRPDWLRNAMGFLDRKCWSGKLSPRPFLDWYLERMNKAIIAAKEAAGGDVKVSLLAHSAGGWLARVYMLEYGIDDIAMLLSLGTPHLPPPKGVRGVVDQTMGLLDYINKASPGDCFSPDVKYICVAGRFLKGESIFPSDLPVIATTGIGTMVATDDEQVRTVAKLPRQDGKNKQWAATFKACLVGQSYKQVCGQADVWGDGVVPEVSAHLHGARNITIEGVYHSMLGAKHPDRPWYGSTDILDQWVPYLK